jgi:cytoskeletal protein CcmA (bactofilin family)
LAGAAGIDLAGDIDVDGTANLDVVDIDGAVDMASTLTLAGNADFNGDLDVDGTTNLDAVDIDGAVNMAADLTMGANILMADDTSIGIADDAERIEFDGAGDISVLGANFGIGTSSPAVALDISSDNSSSVGNTLRITDSDTSMADDQQIGAIEFFSADGGASGSGIVSKIWSQSNSTNPGADLKFDTDGTTRMVIATSSGSVGIGTEAPAKKLHVTGSVDGNYIAHIENTDSDAGYGLQIKSSDGVGNKSFQVQNTSGNDTLQLYGDGSLRLPQNPAFQARPSSEQSDIATGSAVRVPFGTEIFDQGQNFATDSGNSNAGTFTAPITGRYMLTANLYLNTVDSAPAYYALNITTSNRGYESIFDPDFGQDSAYWTVTFSALVDMDASDTAYVTLTQEAGTQQTDIATASYFSGFLAC